jgi:DNA-binding response OmpR family regulator
MGGTVTDDTSGSSVAQSTPHHGNGVIAAGLVPADVLLHRIVVVDGPRSAELIEGLTAEGLGARAVSAATLGSLIAGLVVFESTADIDGIRRAVQTLLRRQAALGVLALADLGDCTASLLNDPADAVLPPAAPVELIAAQLRAMARMIATDPPPREPEVITVRNLTIDLEQRHARVGNHVLDLTPTEFLLLAHLARRRGVVSHAELVGEFHGSGVSAREAKNMLKVHIWRLRSKLAEALPDVNMIVTVRGFGYLLERRSSARTVRPVHRP